MFRKCRNISPETEKTILKRHRFVGERNGQRIDYIEFEVDRIRPAKPGRRVLTLEEFERLRKKE